MKKTTPTTTKTRRGNNPAQTHYPLTLTDARRKAAAMCGSGEAWRDDDLLRLLDAFAHRLPHPASADFASDLARFVYTWTSDFDAGVKSYLACLPGRRQ